MGLLSNAAAILGKEVRTEFRSRELLSTTIVFVLIVVVLFSFTFEPTSTESRRFGPGLLWLAFLFAASLMLQPCFLREHVNDTLSALRLAASDPFAIFLAKIGANTLFLLLTELIMLPVFAVLFNVHYQSQLPALLQQLAVECRCAAPLQRGGIDKGGEQCMHAHAHSLAGIAAQGKSR